MTGTNMLEKTLAMLADVKPGTYLPDDVASYDPAELDDLGRLLDRLIYAPSSLRRVLQQKFGVTITRADVYGEIPTIAELERSFAAPSLLTLDGIFPGNAEMMVELERLMKVSHEFDPPQTSSRLGEYAWQNGSFSYSDAMAYYAMIRTRRPRTIVEIGGGWHTRIAQMACARNGMGRIVSVEPDPGEFLRALEGIELVPSRVQDLETDFFNGLLRDGDMLFIDSTHTVRHDGDVLHIYLRILPGLDASVMVQAHDIFLPETVALEQMRDKQIFWNEQYLLYAYMCGNARTRAIFGSRYHARHNPDMLEQLMHGRYRAGGASFWFEQERAS
jgi:predicted O-methyltransferase YrrM